MDAVKTIVQTEIAVLAAGLNFPEGPVFSSDGSLWAVELKSGNLIRYKNKIVDRFHVGGTPNGLAINNKGLFWFCDAGQNAIRSFNSLTGGAKTIITYVGHEVLNKPNDLAFDKKGNLVFTCPGNSRSAPTGYACVLMRNGTVKKITTGKYFPNGLAFTSNGKSLVLAETYKHRLWKGAWDAENGEWLEPEIWCDVGGPDGPGGPDGMAFGPDGNLYVAVFGTGKIRVVNKEGEVVKQFSLPGINPTNCAFAANGNLLVTEAERGELLEIKL